MTQATSAQTTDAAPILVAEAVELLQSRCQQAFSEILARAASQCSRQGKLDVALLDQNQWLCYEIALTHSDMLACHALIKVGIGSTNINARLGLAFVEEALPAVLTRLEELSAAVDLHLPVLQELRASVEIAVLRQATGHKILAQLGKELADFGGEIADVSLDEQSVLARDTFRRFAEDVVAPLAAEIHRQDLIVPEQILQPLREMGVFGLSIPEHYGGNASDGSENTCMMIAVTEALSEASLAAAGSLITRPEILSRALLAGGTEEQKTHWLPRIATGDALCAIAITEPDYGSDVASLSLKATRALDGWILNGAKTWCTFAGKASLLMVIARTDPDRSLGHRGLSAFLVEKPSDDGHEFDVVQEGGGHLVGRAIRTIGYRGMHSFDLTFQDFLVPDSSIIGGETGIGRGFYLTMAGMTGGRIQTAGRALGLMRAALKAAIQYAKDRRVFNAPLISFPLTQIKLAKIGARFAACRHLAYTIGRELDQGAGNLEASVAKLVACRSAEIVTREALQIHGGMGYAEETSVSRYWIDARVLSIFEGAEETLALKVIARALLEAVLKP